MTPVLSCCLQLPVLCSVHTPVYGRGRGRGGLRMVVPTYSDICSAVCHGESPANLVTCPYKVRSNDTGHLTNNFHFRQLQSEHGDTENNILCLIFISFL